MGADSVEILGKILINVFAAIILIIIVVNEKTHKHYHMAQERLFFVMVYSNILLCTFDAISWVVEKNPGTFNYIINQFVTSSAFIAIPILNYRWFLYSQYNIFKSEKLLKKLERIFIPYIAIYLTVVLTNPLTHWLFYIDENNSFHRGNLFVAISITSYAILFLSFILIIINRKRIIPGHFVPMLIFVIPILITSILAILIYGIAIAWVGTTISIFIIYLFIQGQRLGTDFLTGLYNRRQLNEYLQNRLRARRSNDSFGIAMIDINKFKSINDTWGHNAGDEYLIALSHIFLNTFRSREFISRYAGDEFIIVIDAQSKNHVASAMNRLSKAIEEYNSKSEKPWTISVSTGYDFYDTSEGMNIDDLLNHIDKLMYDSKTNPNLCRQQCNA